jgi:hypothetical protein
MRRRIGKLGRSGKRGASLVLVALALVVLLSVLALAIDLGMLYVARNEAQRAADAAALAGAYAFITTGCTTTGGCVAGGPQEPVARIQAQTMGAQNFILGRAAEIQGGDVSFSYPTPREPQITVSVHRSAERENAVPTIFARIINVFRVDVVARATAEAYSGAVANSCLVPFLVPNCDPQHAGTVNGVCGTADDDPTNGPAGRFLSEIDPQTGARQIANPGRYPGGVYGQPWKLHFATTEPPGPSGSAVPSHWYMVSFENSSSKADVRTYLSQCYPKIISCGDQLEANTGSAIGPINQGVIERIHATGLGTGQGQDTIDLTEGPPFRITGGSNNPIVELRGQDLKGVSDSIVSVPIYDGTPLSPGGNNRVTVIGFMELFLQDVSRDNGELIANAVVLNITGCDASGGGGGGTSTGTPISIRLIRQ